jgi:Arc/MetJ-type ribon-helix-helix transcriptional regulator/RNA polymerase subunit RPABC4/transcription elongation factor Spt4
VSKITFRADDELIEGLEAFDDSKSEVMRRALRQFLESHPEASVNTTETTDSGGSLDDIVAERVDALVERRLEESPAVPPRKRGQDLNVNITLDGDSLAGSAGDDEARMTAGAESSDEPENERKTCGQCGESVAGDHVYCPNCGEKVSRRVFCECGDELRSDWAFCPGCGRRTAAADVLDGS